MLHSHNPVSIITPSFNSAPYIEETYASLVRQTYPDWEWLVVDDGSTDASPEMIRKLSAQDSRIRFFRRESQCKGASACRNTGIDHAAGDYLMFLDADDLLAPFCLEQRLKIMRVKPHLDFGVFNMGMFKEKTGDMEGRVNIYADKTDGYARLFLSYQIPWSITCPVWKRSFVARNNIRFSEQYQRLQDPEFHSKILLLHNPVFDVFKETETDCFYRMSNSKKRNSNASLLRTTSSVLLYYKEMAALMNRETVTAKYNSCLDAFGVNIFHSLLFYTRLSSISPVKNLYREMNKIRTVTNISMKKILFFAWTNRLGLTFIRGAGITRIWNMWIKQLP